MIDIIRHRICRARQGAVALEFALVFPVLLMLLGGVADFGLSLWARGRLSDAVNFGASFAFAAGPNGNSASIESAVQNAANASLTGTTVSATPPACYCLSGTPATAPTAAVACGSTCSGTVTAGKYVMINATYVYSPLFPLYSTVASTSLTESTVVRVE